MESKKSNNKAVRALECCLHSRFLYISECYELFKLQPFQIEFTSRKEDQVQVIISGYRF